MQYYVAEKNWTDLSNTIIDPKKLDGQKKKLDLDTLDRPTRLKTRISEL